MGNDFSYICHGCFQKLLLQRWRILWVFWCILSVDLTCLWHTSCEAGRLEMLAGIFRCHGWTVSSENQTWLSLTLQPFLLCWRDCNCHSKFRALKKKRVTAFCLVSVAKVMKIWFCQIFFSPSYPKLQLLHSSPVPASLSLWGRGISWSLEAVGGSGGITMTLERLHNPGCHQGPESCSSNAQGALWINATLLPLLLFHKASQQASWAMKCLLAL